MYVVLLVYTMSVENILIKIASIKYYDEGIKIICINSQKCYCYLIFVSIMVDYKEEVFIIRIKLDMQHFVCYNSL